MIFMKKMSQKNNKGFSLVELIVVVAIMAVLMGILVPTLVKNVEKSKRQKDESAIEEIRNAMEIKLADPEYSDIEETLVYTNAGNELDITSPDGNAPSDVVDKFLKAVKADLKDKNWKFTSKDYKAAPKVTFVIKDQSVTAYGLGKAPAAGGSEATTTKAEKPTT